MRPSVPGRARPAVVRSSDRETPRCARRRRRYRDVFQDRWRDCVINDSSTVDLSATVFALVLSPRTLWGAVLDARHAVLALDGSTPLSNEEASASLIRAGLVRCLG